MSLADLGQGLAQYLADRKAKKLDAKKEKARKKRESKTGADEQKELERMSMMQQAVRLFLFFGKVSSV